MLPEENGIDRVIRMWLRAKLATKKEINVIFAIIINNRSLAILSLSIGWKPSQLRAGGLGYEPWGTCVYMHTC